MVRFRVRVLACVGIVMGVFLGVPSGAVPSAGALGGAGAVEGAADRAQGRQVFVIISTDATGDGGGPIVAFGQIHGTGHDTVLGPRRDRFEFPDGNVVIRHRAKGTPVEQFDPVACYFKFVEVGRWQVIRGTGAYAGATGGGRYRVEGAGIGEKNAQGECAENQPPRAFYSKVRAVGDLSY